MVREAGAPSGVAVLLGLNKVPNGEPRRGGRDERMISLGKPGGDGMDSAVWWLDSQSSPFKAPHGGA